jgi:hypothetical protein
MIPLACPPNAMYPIQLAECGLGKTLLFAARPGTSGHARPSTTADTRPATGLLPGGGGAPARAVGTPQGGPREGTLLCPVSRPPTERLLITSLSRRRALRIFLRALIIAAGLSLDSNTGAFHK